MEVVETKKRLFAFGDSHTAYVYPTWATILGTCEGITLYNCARAGSDNLTMLQQLIRAIRGKNISKDDIIAIQLTNTDRIVYDGNHQWIDVFNGILMHDKDFVLNNYEFDYGVGRTMDWIYCIKLLLDNIGCEYHIHPLDDFMNITEKNGNQYNYYWDDLKEYDGHFDIEWHKKYVDRYYPNYKYDEDKIEEWKSMVQTTKDGTEKAFINVTTLTGLHFHYNYKTLYTEKEEKDLLNKLKEQ